VTPSSLRAPAHLALLLAAASLAAAACATPLPRVRLHAGAHTFQVEVAATPQRRKRGLMGRTRLQDDAGMLFVFEQKGAHCFWMENTPIPLSVAFLADDGSIVNIEDMQPNTLGHHCAKAAVRHALEVKQGGFQSRGIRPGMRISGGPLAPRRE
jgi:hypothetical protein